MPYYMRATLPDGKRFLLFEEGYTSDELRYYALSELVDKGAKLDPGKYFWAWSA